MVKQRAVLYRVNNKEQTSKWREGYLLPTSVRKINLPAKLFSELKLVTDNLLSIYAAANWEATEN